MAERALSRNFFIYFFSSHVQNLSDCVRTTLAHSVSDVSLKVRIHLNVIWNVVLGCLCCMTSLFFFSGAGIKIQFVLSTWPVYASLLASLSLCSCFWWDMNRHFLFWCALGISFFMFLTRSRRIETVLLMVQVVECKTTNKRGGYRRLRHPPKSFGKTSRFDGHPPREASDQNTSYWIHSMCCRWKKKNKPKKQLWICHHQSEKERNVHRKVRRVKARYERGSPPLQMSESLRTSPSSASSQFIISTSFVFFVFFLFCTPTLFSSWHTSCTRRASFSFCSNVPPLSRVDQGPRHLSRSQRDAAGQVERKHCFFFFSTPMQ